MTFGERVRQARIAKGITQKDLSEIIGTARNPTISEIENGRRYDTAVKRITEIAQALDTTPNELFGWYDLPVRKIYVVKVKRKKARCT